MPETPIRVTSLAAIGFDLFFEAQANTAEKLFGSWIDRAAGFANLHERMQTRRGI